MARHLDPAPFARQHPLVIDDEGAALDAADFLPVQVLHLHDAELLADRLVGVRKQLERELHLRLEALVRPERVARDAVDVDPGFLEVLERVAEIRALLGAAGGVVAGVEVEDQLASALARESEGAAAGSGKAEILDRLAYGFQSFLSLFSN